MHCNHCGNLLVENKRFCTKCGKEQIEMKMDYQKPLEKSFNPSFNYLKIISKRKLIIIVFSIIGVLGIYFSYNYYKEHQESERIQNIIENRESNSSFQSSDENQYSKKEIPQTFLNRIIPSPKVPIINASTILPNWSADEDISGDHELIGLYVGAIGKKPIKISIIGVDNSNNTLIGFSNVNGNSVDFEGYFDVRLRKAPKNQANNIVVFNANVYKITLFESDVINTNGVFQLEFEITDANGSAGEGSWVSYNAQLNRKIIVRDTYSVNER